MVNDTIVRTKSETVETKTPVYKENVPVNSSITEEPPYTDYEKMKGHPFVVDHFKLGDTWKDKLGGFEKEVDLIEGYFKDRIEQGQMKNDIISVKEKLDGIYKLCNIDKTERVTMQIEKLSAYLEFLKKTENIELNHFKYR